LYQFWLYGIKLNWKGLLLKKGPNLVAFWKGRVDHLIAKKKRVLES